MKKLIYAAALILAAALIPVEPANARAETVTHIDSTFQFPQGTTRNFRHTIRLHIPEESNSISQLRIDVPDGLTVRNNISVSDRSGKQINSNISVNGNQIILAFSKPVSPGTKLDIELNHVRRLGTSNAWLYPVFVRFIGMNSEVSIGVARFRIY